MDSGSADTFLERTLAESLSQSGIAIFTATAGRDPAIAETKEELTLFSGTLVKCIRSGIDNLRDQPTLSWSDVRDFVARSIRDRLGPEAPVPKIVSLDDRHGDITKIPFFLNKAHVPTPIVPGADQVSDRTLEFQYWLGIKDRTDPESFGTFIRKFRDGIYVPLAHKRILDIIAAENDPSVIEQFSREYPDLADRSACSLRLSTLRWQQLEPITRVRNAENIEKLREFIESFEGTPEYNIARDRLAKFVWEEVKNSPDIDKLEQFIYDFSDHPLSGEAQVLLSIIKKGRRQPVFLYDAKRLKRLVSLVLASSFVVGGVGFLLFIGVIGVIGLNALNKSADQGTFKIAGSQSIEHDQQQTRKADHDDLKPVKIKDESVQEAKTEIEHPAGDQARVRMADHDAFKAAGNDLVKLKAYVEACRNGSCEFFRQAKADIERIEGDQARQADRKAFEAAGSDLAKLKAYVEACRNASCEFFRQAKANIERIEGDQARQADRKAFEATGSDLAKLKAYVIGCENKPCQFAQQAQAKIKGLLASAFRVFGNHDIYGGDLLREAIHNSTLTSCETACLDRSNCRAYSFDKWNSDCYLKDSIPDFLRDPQSDVGVRNDVPRPNLSKAEIRTCVYRGSTLSGVEIDTINNITEDACKRSCERNPSCVAYTFNKNNGQCTRFDNPNDRTSKQSHAVSGIRTQRKCH